MNNILAATLLLAQLSYGGAPYYQQQLELERAWKLTPGTSDVTIAIIGSGANYELPEIAASIEKNVGELGDGKETDGIDNDGNGYVDDVWGANVRLGTGDPQDLNGHGNVMASIVASSTYGVAPGVKVIPIALLDKNGSGRFADLFAAFDYAKKRNAQIIELTIGGNLKPEIMTRLCNVIKDTGVPVIAPAGNDARDLTNDSHALDPRFAAHCDADNLIIVASSTENNQLAHYSNYGLADVDLAAPGYNVFGLTNTGDKVSWHGTNVSTALATGVLALLKSFHPEYSPAQLKHVLIASSDLFPELSSATVSGGRINAYRALTLAIE